MQNTTEGKSALGLDGNVTALIGYIIPLVALILVFMEKDNKFVRFHSIQSVYILWRSVSFWFHCWYFQLFWSLYPAL